MITSLDQLDFNKKYTYADYVLWQFPERVELLKGKLFPMAVPNVNHQKVSGNLYFKLQLYFVNKKCDVFHAPFDVRLPLPSHKKTTAKVDTVIQPDLCIVCDKSKLDKQGCVGAPDLIVEILSPGNSRREMKDKFELYEAAGVLEYWIIDPKRKSVFVHYLEEKTHKYIAQVPNLTNTDILKSRTFEGLEIELEEVFPED